MDRKLRQECERLQGEVAKLKERLKDVERERKDAETDAKDNDERSVTWRWEIMTEHIVFFIATL